MDTLLYILQVIFDGLAILGALFIASVIWGFVLLIWKSFTDGESSNINDL